MYTWKVRSLSKKVNPEHEPPSNSSGSSHQKFIKCKDCNLITRNQDKLSKQFNSIVNKDSKFNQIIHKVGSH